MAIQVLLSTTLLPPDNYDDFGVCFENIAADFVDLVACFNSVFENLFADFDFKCS